MAIDTSNISFKDYLWTKKNDDGSSITGIRLDKRNLPLMTAFLDANNHFTGQNTLDSAQIGNLVVTGGMTGTLTGNASTATNVEWTGVLNKPTSFTPSAHNHAASDINSGSFPDTRIASATNWNATKTTVDAALPIIAGANVTIVPNATGITINASGNVKSVNNKTGDVTLSAADVNAIATSAKGVAGGVAELGADGKVPTSQLPSYVDDVLEYNNKASFPTTGETGKIYVDKSTNLTWRWSGSAYVEISPSLALGETSSTAYAGDKGKALKNTVDAMSQSFTTGNLSVTGSASFTNTINGSISGNAATASKLGTNAGSATQPVYFSGGVPVATTYTLGKSVPSDAVFTDHTYAAGTGLSLATDGKTFNHSNSITAVTTAGFYKVKYDAQGHITGTTAVTKTDITGLGIPGSDTNTTYTIATGDGNGQIKVTPSSGDAYNVSVKGLGSAAYTNSSAYRSSTWLPTLAEIGAAASSHTHTTNDITDALPIIAGENVTITPTSTGVTISADGKVKTVNNVAPDTSGNVSLSYIKQASVSGNTLTLTPFSGNAVTFTNTNTWNANAVNVAGYVSAPTTSNKNKVWKTDDNGNPGWRDDANTTYSSKAAASGGTDVSLVTTGEKYNWNNKTSNTGTVTSVTIGVGAGLSVNATGAITTSGTRTISIADGYKLPTTTEWANAAKLDANNHFTGHNTIDSAQVGNLVVTGGLTGTLNGDASTVGGHTVGKDVPSNAVFTDTNYYHTSGSWNGLTYTATANGGAGALAFTIPTGTSATTVAVGNHTHSNYLTGITSVMVTTALGFTPYNSTNPSGFTSDSRITEAQIDAIF